MSRRALIMLRTRRCEFARDENKWILTTLEFYSRRFPLRATVTIRSYGEQGFETDLLSDERKIPPSFSRVSLSDKRVKGGSRVPILAWK